MWRDGLGNGGNALHSSGRRLGQRAEGAVTHDGCGGWGCGRTPSSGSTAAGIGVSPRLPKLAPNVNHRAAEILASRLGNTMTSSDVSSLASTSRVASRSLFAQIDATATTNGRSHDISHQHDSSSRRGLAPSVPPSLIDESDHIYERSFFPTPGSVFLEREGMWKKKIFPSDAPSSRQDAVMLGSWVEKSMEAYKQRVQSRSNSSDKEVLVQAVEDLVPMLSVALHELVRQVSHQCPERGMALQRLWRTYVELFNRVLVHMQASLRTQRQRTLAAQTALDEKRQEKVHLKHDHPTQMRSIISTLETHYSEKQTQLEMALKDAQEENFTLRQDMRNLYRKLEEWYPLWSSYKDSPMKHILAATDMNNHANKTPTKPEAMHSATKTENASSGQAAHQVHVKSDGETDDKAKLRRRVVDEDMDSAEVAIAEDFKRLLGVLPPDVRKSVGADIAFLFEPESMAGNHRRRTKQRPTSGSKKEEERMAELAKMVHEQEERIQSMRREIRALDVARLQALAVQESENAVTMKKTLSHVVRARSVSDLGAEGPKLRTTLDAPEEEPTANIEDA